MSCSSLKPVTVRNYETWLRPWVTWLKEKAGTGQLQVDAHVLKTYLDSRYRDKEFSSYMRVGRQIAGFVNRHLSKKVDVIMPLAFNRKLENVQMPQGTLKKLIMLCKRQVSALRDDPGTVQVRQRYAKYLGKSPI